MNDDAAKPAPRKRRPTAATGRKLYRDAALREGRGFTPDKQADYLALLAQRVQATKAAEMCDVSMQAVRNHRAKDPAFVEAEAHARAESIAPVVDKLYDLAMDGHMTAILFLLQNAAPDEWKDMRQMKKTVQHTGTVTHEVEAGQSLQRIAALEATLRDRAVARGELAPPVIDVEVVPE
jgi:hypothetical protein